MPIVPLGKQLRAAREAVELTQSDVAKALGVSQPTVFAWERGDAVPRPARIRAIAKLLKLDAAALLRDAFLRGAA